MEDKSNQNAVEVKVERVLVNPDDPPKPAHKFVWTRVGSDLMLDVGHFDLVELRNAITEGGKGGKEGTAKFYVTDRFILTPPVVNELIEAMTKLKDDLEEKQEKAAEEASATAKGADA